ncbi:MAG TPA: tetratricopeptide repeat protein [Vineibacter sp.]|nr:tetratricopeptide repeat protein [Vineibacter sp.]
MGWSAAGGRMIVGQASAVRFVSLLGLVVPLLAAVPSWADSRDAMERCHAAYQSGAFDIARGLCARAAKDQSLSAEIRAFAHLYRAMSSCTCEEALPDYDAAVALAPAMGVFYMSRGNAYHDLKRHDEALRDLMTAAKLEPREPAVYASRGNVLMALDRPTEALADFERLTNMTPKSSDAWRLKGDVEARLGRLDRADGDYARSLKLDSRNGHALAGRAFVRVEAGDLKGARADIDAAVRYQPNEPQYALDRGRIALLAGDPNRAIPDMIQAMHQLPEGARRHYAAIWLSMAILRTGRELEFMPTVLQVVYGTDKEAWPNSASWLYLTALSKARKQSDMGDGAEYKELSRRAADQPNANPFEDRVCEYGFFMGMYQVLHKDTGQGERLLRQAAERRAYSWCHTGAKVELARLRQRAAQGPTR